MVIMILERVPVALRGELTRWLIEPRAGVFVGQISAAVRDRLWWKVCEKSQDGGATMIHSAANEQGFTIKNWGDPSRNIVDFEGLLLIQRPRSPSTTKKQSDT
jgi:CRISPR-associated protein Cas2